MSGWLSRNSQLVPMAMCGLGVSANIAANIDAPMGVTWLLTLSSLAHGVAIGYLHRDWRTGDRHG